MSTNQAFPDAPRPQDDWEIRYALAESLGDSPSPEKLERLLEMTADPETSVRCAVAVSLASYPNDDRALDGLVDLLSDPEPWVRIRAVQSLAKFGESKAPDFLTQHLEGERDEKVLATIVKSLGGFGDPRFVPVLLPFLEHDSARVRANTIEGLGCIEYPGLASVLEPLLEDPSSRVRANAARVMSGFAETVAASRETISEMLHSPDQYERASAVYALGELRDEKFLPDLLSMLGDKSFVVVRNVVDALVKFGNAVERRIIHAMKSDDPTVRANCASVLGKVGGAYCLKSLIPLRHDPDGEVRSRAEEALDLLRSRLRRAGATSPADKG